MWRISDVIIMIFLLTAAISDWKSKKLSGVLMVVMSVSVIVLTCLGESESAWSIVGGLLIGAVFFVISRCTKEAIGYGDSWVVTLLGIYLGGKRLLGLLMAAFFVSGIYALVCLARYHWKRGVTIPFVPFLAIAYVVVMFL